MNLLYISPERLQVEGFWDYLKKMRISFFAIDEAHCISQWGHDFRPDYLALANISTYFPNLPVTAFTATATPRVAQDIVERLNLRQPFLTCASFNRANLFYQVIPKNQIYAQLVEFLHKHPDESGIIYRISRKSVDETTSFLQEQGFKVKAYHAGLPDTERSQTQEEFRQDTCPIIVATIAFGMGIDKANVRFVIHADLPKNMEGYYQETGRAGRDGDPAVCSLYYDQRDIAQLLRFAHQIEDEAQKNIAIKQVYHMLEFARKNCCRRKTLLQYFGEVFQEPCGTCDICTGQVQCEDATINAQKALSAMVRSGNRFGATHIIDILMGAKTKRIREFAHDQLPTYGIGKNQPRHYWRLLLDALISHGMVYIADPVYPTLQVTNNGWKILRAQEKFQILKHVPKAPRVRKRDFNTTSDDVLFELLRTERSRIAQEIKLPPYIIFHDSTLRALVSMQPKNVVELLRVPGVGERKMKNYGEAFLKVIADYQK